jgi:glutathione S-transferase
MKLYDARRAPNPRRVRWFMDEKGIDDIEIVGLDLLAGDHKTPEYLARAGLPNTPSLTLDSGATITESLAICRYLESCYPTPNLFGRTPEEIAVIEMWTRRAELLTAYPLMMAVRHTHPGLAALEANQSAEFGQLNRVTAERSLRLFDKRLADSPWIAADRISIADGVMFIGMDFARLVKFQIPEELANLTRWMGAMRERPSAMAGV